VARLAWVVSQPRDIIERTAPRPASHLYRNLPPSRKKTRRILIDEFDPVYNIAVGFHLKKKKREDR
jgi:hypothetical protein